MKKFYITTPIYYPSGNMHIGHTYTTVAADTMTRYKKQRGFDCYFLTGTDEHGQKIENAAKKAGVKPIEYVDKIVGATKDLWSLMEIQYDDFIRTSEERHVAVVQRIFKQLYDQGDIYKSEYEGQYCTPCEAFWTKTQIKEGNVCPDCGRPTETVREKAYFFRMSKYQDWLVDYIEENPDFIQPPSRAKEMLQNFLKPGLQDLCVSRTSFKWGVPVDFDEGHVVYVWIDALSNYISALGYLSDDDVLMQKFWPADVHLVGKEIVRFHAIYWPIILKALSLPLPKQIFAHGWLLFGGDKMSKSKGNIEYAEPIVAKYGADALRYYLMREMPFGADGNYTNEALLQRVNSDLANDLGNLVSRTSAMIQKYFNGVMPKVSTLEEVDDELVSMVKELPLRFDEQMDRLQFSQALSEVWKVIGFSNKYIDLTQPWILGKSEDKKERLGTVLYLLAEALRYIAVLIYPCMPSTPEKIFPQIGVFDDSLKTYDSLKSFGGVVEGTELKKGEPLFPRLDIEKELVSLAEEKQKAGSQTCKNEEAGEKIKRKNPISIEDFDKLDLRIATVLSCEKLDNSDKLLKFNLLVGNETREVVSGIAKYYRPEDLIGKKLVLLANLAPRKIRGVLSEGMLLSALSEDGMQLKLLTTEGDIESGAEIG